MIGMVIDLIHSKHLHDKKVSRVSNWAKADITTKLSTASSAVFTVIGMVLSNVYGNLK